MGRTAGPPKERKHVHLSEGYWDELTDLYKPQGISPSHVINQLVGFHLKRIREKMNLKAKPEQADAEVEIDLEGVSGDD